MPSYTCDEREATAPIPRAIEDYVLDKWLLDINRMKANCNERPLWPCMKMPEFNDPIFQAAAILYWLNAFGNFASSGNLMQNPFYGSGFRASPLVPSLVRGKLFLAWLKDDRQWHLVVTDLIWRQPTSEDIDKESEEEHEEEHDEEPDDEEIVTYDILGDDHIRQILNPSVFCLTRPLDGGTHDLGPAKTHQLFDEWDHIFAKSCWTIRFQPIFKLYVERLDMHHVPLHEVMVTRRLTDDWFDSLEPGLRRLWCVEESNTAYKHMAFWKLQLIYRLCPGLSLRREGNANGNAAPPYSCEE
ncbi:hypothetical protein F4778DRAFT_794196 [Xylariomycetidae sp. FL2044]|nr:hypothetical protein F4778DRAFT_794196 [Xylariomycetidae sp. FL2044]